MENVMDKLDSSSSDLLMINFGKIKEIFPEVVKEGKIDFDSLRFLLGDYIEGESERYNFTWFGKSKTRKIAQTPTTATLRPDKGRSVNWRASKNFFIEGDNLEALKVLQKSLHKSIKLIYIDPPYNTGNEFIYPDNFQDNIETYLSYTGQRSDEGVKFSTNVESGGRYHTNWLNMMYSRLRLARNLLKDDGAIFISIGDEELCNLKKMCDEIFGEENYRGMVSRLTGTRMGSGNTKISSEMDYILIYAKSDDFNFLGLPMSEKDLSIYDQEDENGRYLLRSLRRTGGENRREDRPSMFYPVISPDGEKVYPIAPEGWESRWVCGKDKYEELLKNDEIVWKKVKKAGEEKWQIYQKHYVGEATKFVANCWNDLDGNKKATREVNALFDGAKVFHHPKPVDLLERIIKITIEKNAEEYVLDFFGGSSTTAHAALKLKKEGYKINFGIIQLPEKCDESSVAFQNGFKTISDIGIGRIDRWRRLGLH